MPLGNNYGCQVYPNHVVPHSPRFWTISVDEAVSSSLLRTLLMKYSVMKLLWMVCFQLWGVYFCLFFFFLLLLWWLNLNIMSKSITDVFWDSGKMLHIFLSFLDAGCVVLRWHLPAWFQSITPELPTCGMVTTWTLLIC